MRLKNKIIITDIGSTTTKAILLIKTDTKYDLIGCVNTFTTVEKPYEDVTIGIYNSLKKLESQTGYKIIKAGKSQNIEGLSNLQILDDYNYLTTSSAGGGLRILVIGLTLLDTVCSAERVAYGAGGIVVNSLSIDDKRNNLERLQTLNSTRPDIILFCGGTDGGTTYGVLRFAINLSLANIKQKFSENTNIPLVYAGNKDAVNFIESVLKCKFDLQVIDNIRPTIREENLEHAKEVIHNLFLNNVMEIAPGYPYVKKIVDTDILPTPVGVLNTMKLLGNTTDNVIAFDMGGATTDVYTNIQSKHNRSVSANYGMSYSMGNIVLESNFIIDFRPYIKAILGINNEKEYTLKKKQEQTSITSSVSYVNFIPTKRRVYENDDDVESNEQIKVLKEYFLNYVANKVLYPDSIPKNDFDLFIEHIIAISGIKMSILAHFENHFRNKPTYFEQISKYLQIMKYYYLKTMNIFHKTEAKLNLNFTLNEPLYYPMFTAGKPFTRSDINIIIGAGGVLANANKIQAIFILIESMKSYGIFQLFRDKQFISPHVGVLSVINESIARDLLYKECLEKLAIYIRFKISKHKSKKTLITVNISGKEVYEIKADDVFYKFCSLPTKIVVSCNDNFNIQQKVFDVDQNVYFIIDTRIAGNPNSINLILDKLQPYRIINFEQLKTIIPQSSLIKDSPLYCDTHLISFKLPIPGKIYVKQGDNVYPETLIGDNQHDLPQVFVIMLNSILKKSFNESIFKEGICLKLNDKVFVGDIIFSFKGLTVQSTYKGVVDSIYYETGTIVLKEIQNYHPYPVTVNVAQLLNVKKKDIYLCMQKNIGDFIYEDEVLAKNYLRSGNFITSPSTGTIKTVDTTTGIVTIQYDKKPFIQYAMCYGQVVAITNAQEVAIKVESLKITGRIGFGKDVGGRLAMFENKIIKPNSIVYAGKCVSYADLIFLSKKNINGLICNTISYSCLKKFIMKDIGVGITGAEVLPFSVIILKGFSSESIDEDNTLFYANEGNYVLMKTQTQIRAGAIRPSIYLKCN